MARFLACWVTQAESGWEVTPARCTRRVWSSMKNRTYNVFSRIVSTVKKSVARMPQAWALRNSDQVGPSRRGAGPSPSARRILLMVVAPTRTPTLRSSPWIRTWPHIGFSMARRRTSARTSGSMGRRPGFLLDLWVHFRRTSSRCHRSSVWGVTRNEFHLSLGRRRAAAARKARSTGRSLGRRTCRRRTLSWCRSTAFSISSTCPRLGHGITPKRLRNNRWIRDMTTGRGCYRTELSEAYWSSGTLQVGRLVRCGRKEHRKTCVVDAISGAPSRPFPRPPLTRLGARPLVRGHFQQRRRTGIEPAWELSPPHRF